MSGLIVRAEVTQRDVVAEVEVPEGQTLAVVGPNAAGKSTLLQVAAGLLRPDHGVVRLGERVLTDTAAGVQVPVHRRRIGWLAQSGLLFGHLSVLDNVAFGPRSRGLGRAAALEQANQWLDRLALTELAGRRPGTLSGGQAQRVALARTLAADPEALLLDEPTSALDVHVAAGLRRLLAETLTGRTTILVSHDLLDIVALADQLAVIEAGRVVEQGPVAEVLARPSSAFGARLADVNIIRGTLLDAGTLTAGDLVVHGIADDDQYTSGRALATLRPAAITVALTAPQTSARNVWASTIRALETMPNGIRVRADVGPISLAADVTAASAAAMGLRPAMPVWLAAKAQEVTITPLPG